MRMLAVSIITVNNDNSFAIKFQRILWKSDAKLKVLYIYIYIYIYTYYTVYTHIVCYKALIFTVY